MLHSVCSTLTICYVWINLHIGIMVYMEYIFSIHCLYLTKILFNDTYEMSIYLVTELLTMCFRMVNLLLFCMNNIDTYNTYLWVSLTEFLSYRDYLECKMYIDIAHGMFLLVLTHTACRISSILFLILNA